MEVETREVAIIGLMAVEMVSRFALNELWGLRNGEDGMPGRRIRYAGLK